MLFMNRGYLLLLISYGINVGIFYAISTLLNRLVIKQFPVSTLYSISIPDLLFDYEFNNVSYNYRYI